MFSGITVDLGYLGFGYLMGKDTTNTPAAGMHLQHDAYRVFPVQGKNISRICTTKSMGV
jgi:hypothetical protein